MSARLSLVPKPVRKGQPSVYDLEHLPIARCGEFDMSDFETRQTRRLIYSINKQGRFRYRTMRENNLLQIWRIK